MFVLILSIFYLLLFYSGGPRIPTFYEIILHFSMNKAQVYPPTL